MGGDISEMSEELKSVGEKVTRFQLDTFDRRKMMMGRKAVTFQNFTGAEKRLRKSDALFSGLALDTQSCIFKIYVTK